MNKIIKKITGVTLALLLITFLGFGFAQASEVTGTLSSNGITTSGSTGGGSILGTVGDGSSITGTVIGGSGGGSSGGGSSSGGRRSGGIAQVLGASTDIPNYYPSLPNTGGDIASLIDDNSSLGRFASSNFLAIYGFMVAVFLGLTFSVWYSYRQVDKTKRFLRV